MAQMREYPKPPFPPQPQTGTGTGQTMDPVPDCGEQSYKGSGKLDGYAAIITGGDSGIGRAVAIAYAREGADVLIAYLDEDEEAKETAEWVRKAGRKAVLVPGDLCDEAHCKTIVETAVREFGKIDVLVNNAAFQKTRSSLDEISTEEFDRTMRTNLYAMFWLTKGAVPHMQPGSAIINTMSINADTPKPKLLPYSMTKAAIQNFSGSCAQLLAEKGIRVNAVAPGPIWTPLIPATMPDEQVTKFGSDYPMARPGQPAELAPVYVLLASPEASYVSGASIAVTGGKPIV